MGDFADPSDVAAIWRELTDEEIVVAERRIEQAERMVRRLIPPVDGLTIDQRVEAGTLGSDDVQDVVVEMVRRVMMIPGYVRQQSITVDDATKSQTFDTSVANGTMFISDSERSMLIGRASSSRAFTIMPAAGPRWGPRWDAVVTPWT